MERQRTPVLALLAAAVTGAAALGLALLIYRANPATLTTAALGATTEADLPGLVREGNSVTIPPGSPYREQVSVAAVEQRNLEQTAVLPAQVEADPAHVYNVLPPLGGRVIELKVGLGDRVQQGQPLVVIDSGDLAQASSDVNKAKAQAILTHRTLERARSLTQAGGGAEKDQEAAANDAAQADAELARAQARLKTITGSAALTGGRTFTVAAPAAGVITNLSIAPGTYINDLTQTIMTVSNLDRVWVTASVPEANIGFVAKGQMVDVTFIAYPGETFHSTVLFINDIMEPDTRRTKVRIGFPNPDGRFKPNMFASVTFRAPAKRSLFVPNGALLMNNDSTTVFVETAPWTFVRRTVQTGYDTDGSTAITSGLSPGDRVVSRGGVLLND